MNGGRGVRRGWVMNGGEDERMMDDEQEKR